MRKRLPVIRGQSVIWKCDQFRCRRTDAVRRNDVVGKGCPLHRSAGGIPIRAALRVGIVDQDLLAGGVQIPAEIARPLFGKRHRVAEQIALARPESFVTAVEEQLVPDDSAAEIRAELILHERSLACAGPVCEEIRGVQRPVAQVLVRAAMKVVAATPGRHVDYAARVTAVLGAVVVRLHAEFGDRVGDWNQCGDIAVSDVHRNTVKERDALVRRAAADLVVARRENVLARQVPVGGTLRHNARHQVDQVQDIAAVQRQFLNRPRSNHLAQRRIFRLQQRRRGRNLDLLRHVADLHCHVDTDRGFHLHRDVVAQI